MRALSWGEQFDLAKIYDMRQAAPGATTTKKRKRYNKRRVTTRRSYLTGPQILFVEHLSVCFVRGEEAYVPFCLYVDNRSNVLLETTPFDFCSVLFCSVVLCPSQDTPVPLGKGQK